MPRGVDDVGARCLAHVQALCAPDLAGRLAGSEGEARAVRYLLEQLRSMAGLASVQVEPLPVVVPVLDAMPRLRVEGPAGGCAFALLEDFGVAVQGAASGGEARAVARWIGHADPAPGWPDAQGRVLVCWGAPARPLPVAEAFARYLAQLRCARDAGAAALLRVVDDVSGRKVMLHRREEPGLPVLEITPRVARTLFTRFPSLEDGAEGARVELELPLRVARATSAGNVVARLGHGSPRLVLLAHHDGVGQLPDGRCFAGAQDNASGVALLLELLAALAADLTRDGALLGVFTAAEETGLFGAEALAGAHPDWWAADPVVLVLDELAGAVGEPLHVLASAELRQRLERSPCQESHRLRRGPLPELAFADHLPLWQRGLRQVGIATAPDRRAERAHRLTDTPEHLSAARLAELLGQVRLLVHALWAPDSGR